LPRPANICREEGASLSDDRETAGDGSMKRRLTAVLAVDICGFSAAAERDEQAALLERHALDALFGSVVAKWRGRVFSRQGDGFFAEFPSAADAAEAALEFQRSSGARRTQNPASLLCHAGLHLGDIHDTESGDLLGHGVNIAARLQQDADVGGILASAPFVGLVRDVASARFRRRGAVTMKNISAPIDAYDITEAKAAGAAGPRLKPLHDFARRRSTLVGGVVAVAVLVNLVVLAELLRRDERVRMLASAEETARVLEEKVGALTVALGAKVGAGADLIAHFAARDAAASLLQSEVPDKRRAVALIEAGDFGAAADALERVYDAQMEAQTPVTARAQTLREIAATVYHADTQRALAALKTLYDIAPDDAVAVYQLGGLYNQLNQPAMARAYFVAAQRMAPVPSRLAVLAEIGIARAAMQSKDFAAAEKALNTALAASQKDGYAEEETLAELKLGALEFFKGDLEQSFRHRERALVLARSTGDRFSIAEAQNTLGSIAMMRGDFKEARSRLSSAAAESRAIDDARGLASALVNLAECEVAAGEAARAKSLAEEALAIAERDRLPNLSGMALDILARLAFDAGDVTEACEFSAAALALLGGGDADSRCHS
jgi:class 3 adenylate cyclase